MDSKDIIFKVPYMRIFTIIPTLYCASFFLHCWASIAMKDCGERCARYEKTPKLSIETPWIVCRPETFKSIERTTSSLSNAYEEPLIDYSKNFDLYPKSSA